jgi:hypothetical protein
MNRSCPHYPMPYPSLEMQNPYFGMEFPYNPTQELMQHQLYPGFGMHFPFYPCPGPGPIPSPMPCPGMGFPPIEVQRMVREMLEMVRVIYQEECERIPRDEEIF